MLTLTPVEATCLHGAIALAMKHPEVSNKMKAANSILSGVRKRLVKSFVLLGFSEVEAQYLDNREI